MKIYNKKNFFIGLFGELLFIALLVFNIRRGEASFLYVCTALMWLAIGGRIIFRSLSLKHSREDLLLERDERNRHINLKASQRALQITQILPRSSITATIPDGPQLPPSFRRLMMVPFSSAPIISTMELMFSQIKRAITVPMEP